MSAATTITWRPLLLFFFFKKKKFYIFYIFLNFFFENNLFLSIFYATDAIREEWLRGLVRPIKREIREIKIYYNDSRLSLSRRYTKFKGPPFSSPDLLNLLLTVLFEQFWWVIFLRPPRGPPLWHTLFFKTSTKNTNRYALTRLDSTWLEPYKLLPSS